VEIGGGLAAGTKPPQKFKVGTAALAQ